MEFTELPKRKLIRITKIDFLDPCSIKNYNEWTETSLAKTHLMAFSLPQMLIFSPLIRLIT